MLSLFVAAACGGPDEHDHPHLTTGEQYYAHHCAGCHELDGEGEFIKGVPPVRYTQLGISELAGLIRGHARGDDSRMPSFASMPRDESVAIAVYVRRSLSKN